MPAEGDWQLALVLTLSVRESVSNMERGESMKENLTKDRSQDMEESLCRAKMSMSDKWSKELLTEKELLLLKMARKNLEHGKIIN
jgi:hypothetical protein